MSRIPDARDYEQANGSPKRQTEPRPIEQRAETASEGNPEGGWIAGAVVAGLLLLWLF